MRRALLALLLCAAPAAGCGGDAGATDAGGRPQLVVSAASSLKAPLTRCAARFRAARVRLQFGGSDVLAAQVRQGAPVDVFAAANTALPEGLAAEGELADPIVFATNRLVLAAPADDATVQALSDLGTSGVKLVIGAEGVPVGDHARAVIAETPGAAANIRSEEPDVAGVVGKLTQGGADAGFVYASDLRAAGDRLREVPLPARFREPLAYGAGVVAATRARPAAEAFVRDLRAGGCRDALRDAGFGAP